MNTNSPSSLRTKLKPYQSNQTNEIMKGFTMFKKAKNLKGYKTQNSYKFFQINNQIIYDDSQMKPRTKKYQHKMKIVMKDPKTLHKYKISTQKNSLLTSGQKIPTKYQRKQKKEESKKPRKRHVRSKEQKRNFKLSGTFDCSENSEISPVYIDTGSSNMQ